MFSAAASFFEVASFSREVCFLVKKSCKFTVDFFVLFGAKFSTHKRSLSVLVRFSR